LSPVLSELVAQFKSMALNSFITEPERPTASGLEWLRCDECSLGFRLSLIGRIVERTHLLNNRALAFYGRRTAIQHAKLADDTRM